METYSNYSSTNESQVNNAEYGNYTSAPGPEIGLQANGESWIPEEYRGGILDRFETPADLCKAYMSLNSLMAKRREDYSLQDKQAFLQMREEALGIPQGPDGYQIDVNPFDNNGKIIENHLNENELEFMKNLSSCLELTNEQAQLQCDVVNEYIQDCVNYQNEQVENASISNGSMLAEMWGEGNIERCIADVETGINVAARMLGCDEEELKQELEYPMAELCCPNLINLFRNLAQLGGRGYGHGLSAGSTPTDARNQIELLKNSEEFKKAVFAGGPALQQKMQELKVLTEIANRER